MHCNNGGCQVYRTVELLADGTKELRSKGTRVWKAVEVVNGEECGQAVVLKDAWVDTTRPREGETAEKVQSAKRPDDLPSTVQSSFVSVACHGDVFLDDERTLLDCTSCFSWKDDTIVCEKTPHHRTSRIDDSQETLSRRLVHYRIVFNEIGSRISEETSAATIFRALTNVARSK